MEAKKSFKDERWHSDKKLEFHKKWRSHPCHSVLCMKFQKHHDKYILVIIIVSESKELWPLNQAAFWISDRLHSALVQHCTAALWNGIVSGF